MKIHKGTNRKKTESRQGKICQICANSAACLTMLHHAVDGITYPGVQSLFIHKPKNAQAFMCHK